MMYYYVYSYTASKVVSLEVLVAVNLMQRTQLVSLKINS